MTESEVMKTVLRQLKNLRISGSVIWHSRLNSGKVQVGFSWVQLCEIGTPDIISLIDCKNGKLAVLFIECKRTGMKKLRFEQQEFFNNMEDKPMTLCALINDPSQLWQAIEKAKLL